MLKKSMSFALAIALACALGGTSALANTPSDPEPKTMGTETPSKSVPATKNEAKPNEKLRADMLKLVADAKAGKMTRADRPQMQPAKSNNLSKRTKIAIGVGIAVAVVAVVLIARSPILNDGR